MRLVLPACAAWIAALLAVATGAAHIVWIACTVVAIPLTVWCVVHRRGGRVAVAAITLCAAGLVSVSAGIAADTRRPDVLEAAARESTVTVVAIVDGLAQSTSRGPQQRRMPARAIRLDDALVRVPITVFAPVADAPPIGATIRVRGQVVLTERTDTTSALVFADDAVIVSAGPPWYLAWANDIRRGFVELCSMLPGDGGALLPGLAVGDTSAVGPDLDAAMKTSSLSHLTAVSGANCAIVVACALLLSARLGAGRVLRVVIALLVLVAFVILVTPQASVIRASAMAALALLVHLGGRPSGGVPVLSGSVIVLLVVNPWYAYDAGFALSVCATGGLLLLTRPLVAALGNILPRALAMLIAVPLAAQLACQPVLVLLSSSISLYGVAANILAAPAAPVGTVVGLLACVLAPVVPWAGAALAWVAFVPAAWIAGVARATSALPGALIPWLPGVPGALLLAAVSAAVCGLVMRPQWLRHWTGMLAAGTLCLSLGASVGLLGTPSLTRAVGRPGDWVVAACDVGQGDGVLLRAGGATMLVDTGREPEPIAGCLDTLGVRQIDVLVLTHYDADHVGGLPGVIEYVDRAIVQAVHDPAGERVTGMLEQKGVPVSIATAGARGAIGGIDYSVLWPVSREATGNAGSIVLHVELDGIRMLMLGDLGEAEQERLLADRAATTPVDIVKVAHHGSDDQCAELYARIAASLAIVSVGADNTYGHPADDTLNELRGAGSHVLRTDRRGTILISARADALSVWSERSVSDRASG